MDTGATSTIVSEDVFLKIPEEERPQLFPVPTHRKVSTADGGHLVVLGSSDFYIQLGPLKLKRNLLVARIDDEVLLGADILQQDEEGPADLILSQSIMKLRNEVIPLQQVEARLRRVRVADHYIVPGMSEAIIEAFVDPASEDEVAVQPTLVEASSVMSERYGLLMAPSLVDLSSTTTAKVRVLNPFDDEVSLKQDAVLGYAEEVSEDECHSPAGVAVDDLVRVSKVDDNHASSSPRQSNRVPDHLQRLYEDASADCPRGEQEVIAKLLIDFQDVFSRDEYDLGLTHLTEHVIETGDSVPIKQAPHRVPAAFANEDQKALDKLLHQGVVRASTSPWASPIVLVRKKDGSVRWCTDFRRVNSCTKKDAFPIPKTSDCLDAVAGASLFSTLDITSAYHQIPVREEDIPKTAFTTKYGLFEYVTMPFGLCNATATFQRVMELALSGLQWVSCLIYLDDVIVYSSNFSDQVSRLRGVFARIRDAGLKLKPTKCQLFKKEVCFLGHILSERGVLPNPDNVKKLQDWPAPHNVKQVRSFLGLGNYYRRFVKEYSKMVKPLTDLTKKDVKFEWTEKCGEAFEALKQALLGPDVMAYPKDEGSFILDTDACDVSIGCVLSQLQDGVERVIAYGSRTLNRAERNYCVTDRELLAVKYFVEYYKHYLLGRHFLVRSDHQALKWLFSLKDPKSRTARWIEVLSAYDFSVEYRPGQRHGNADGMSRCLDPRNCSCDDELLQCGPCEKCRRKTEVMLGSSRTEKCSRIKMLSSVAEGHIWSWCTILVVGCMICLMYAISPVTGGFFEGRQVSQFAERVNRSTGDVLRSARQTWLVPYSTDQLRKKQKADPDIEPLFKWMESGQRPHGPEVCSSSAATRHYWQNWDSLEVHDGLLFRKFPRKNGTSCHLQLLVPREMRDEVLYQMHNALLSGHLGQRKTKEKTLQRFYWYGLRDDVNLWIARCDTCAAVKAPDRKPRAPLGKQITGAPWDRLAVDILGPLPLTARGNKFVFVVTDHFSKWVEIFAVPDQTAETCAEVLLNEVIARYSCPYEILSDQGRNFEGRVFADLCRMLEVRKKRTSPANPQCNGLTERFNRTLLRMVKAYLKGQQTGWDKHLGCLAAAYRATMHESTGLTPNMLMMGREVRLPAELMFGKVKPNSTEVASYGEWVTKLRDRMQHAHDVARKYLEAATKRQKDYYDAKGSYHSFRNGDLVWYASELGQLHLTPKLRNPFIGPVLVLKKFNDLNYLLQFDATGTKRVVHCNKMKPYLGSQTLKWAKAALRKFARSN